MRSPAIALLTVLCLGAGSSRLSAASDTTTKTIEARVRLASRTALAVSSELLQFVLPDADQSALAAVDFVAGVRTHAGAEVILTIEAAGPLQDGDLVIRFAGEAEGILAGSMSSARSSVVGRWIGSGRRSGRIVFTLRSSVAGSYSVPVRFVLSAP